MSFDTAGFTLLNGLYPSAAPLWTLLNDPRAAIVLVLIAVAVLRMENAWRWALPAILTVMVSDVVTARLLKPMIDRDRPCEVIAEAYVPLDEGKPHCGSGASMPSSHAANSMALGVVLASPGLVVVSLIAGTARVVGGQHWPSDVVAGWVFGLALGWVVRAGCEKAFGWR